MKTLLILLLLIPLGLFSQEKDFKPSLRQVIFSASDFNEIQNSLNVVANTAQIGGFSTPLLTIHHTQRRSQHQSLLNSSRFIRIGSMQPFEQKIDFTIKYSDIYHLLECNTLETNLYNMRCQTSLLMNQL